MATAQAAFDTVGHYSQDQINGFSEDFLNRFIAFIKPQQSHAILDLMGGDGNLSARIIDWCNKNGVNTPKLTMLEYSRVQCEFAKKNLGSAADVVWGDALQMKSLDTKKAITPASYDRVVIKSSNHEIPLARQIELYRKAFEMLEPGGYFFNLGMLFDEIAERDELAEIGRCKDRLAGMTQAVLNRHWLTRKELYDFLEEVGFTDIRGLDHFDYHISSEIVSKYYFSKDDTGSHDMEFQSSQARARNLRKAGRITFDHYSSMMRCPGEITIARKPGGVDKTTDGGENGARTFKIFREYPYDAVRKIKAHRDLLTHAASFVYPGAAVLDLGCGIGLFSELLESKTRKYLGVDLFDEYIKICRERYSGKEEREFVVADMNSFESEPQQWDCAALLNSIYINGVDPEQVLGRVYDALVPFGIAIISGPLSRNSYKLAEPHIRAQVQQDGQVSKEIMDGIRAANDKLLSDDAHYFSAEGLVEMLRRVGFESFPYMSNEFFYGNAYLVVARK